MKEAFFPLGGTMAPDETPQIRTPDSQGSSPVRIPVANISPNRYPPRAVYPDGLIDGMVEMLKEQGQLEPIHVIQKEDNPLQYIVADGWTRVLAIRKGQLFDGMVLAWLHRQMSEEAASWYGFNNNEGRNQHTAYDRARYFMVQRSEAGLSLEEIGKRSRLSVPTISSYLSFEKLPKNVRRLISEQPDRFGLTIMRALAALSETQRPKVLLDMAQRYLDGKISVQGVEQILRRSKHAAAGAQTVAKHYALKGGKLSCYTNGSFALRVKVAKDRREQFEDELRTLLDKFGVTSQASNT